MKRRARSRWLLPLCVSATLIALAASACNVPEFEFPLPPAPGAAGDQTVIPPVEHCVNGLKDAELGESDFDCGRGCTACGAGKTCGDLADCETGLLCQEGTCISPECPDGFADCNQQNADACEVSTRTDANNCSACGNVCQLPHAEAECSAGECHIATDGCSPGYADCNGDPKDGCEVNLDQDKLSCGACNKVCPAINGAPFCADGACQITCAPGFDDCDDKRENGCEKDVSKDANNCGGCGKQCKPQSGGTAYCKDDTCGETICPTGFGDCNGDPADGCEVDLRIDAKNCNSCGNLCLAANGTASCGNRVCQVKSCDTGYANCNNGYADGCEVNTVSDASACGGCGKPCVVDNGTPKCDMGTCAVSSCSGNFRDCDGDAKTGCEINVGNNTKNCGGCGAAGSDCSTKYANATSACSGSVCSAPMCKSNFDDCSNGTADGCEKDVSGDANNCGACKVVCGTTNAGGTTCGAGKCNPNCNAGWGKCTTPEKGCVTPLGTTSDCTKCGDACSTPKIFCDPAGCVDHRDIVVSGSGVNAISGWTSSGAPSVLTASHTLAYALNSNRMLLVGVVASDSFLDPESVQYGTTEMTRAAWAQDGSNQSYAGIYYLLDAQLPDAGTAKTVKVTFATGAVWGHGGFDVLEVKNAAQLAPIASATSTGGNCGDLVPRGVKVDFSQTGSLVYAVLSARGATKVPTFEAGSPPDGPISHWNAQVPNPNNHTGSSAYAFSNSSGDFNWSFADCYNSAGVGVAIKRLNWN